MAEHGASHLHPLVAGFGDAHAYDRGRPVYGDDVAQALMAELGLDAGEPVLELGAGTGQLSRALLAAGLEVSALEPLAGMREQLAHAIGRERVREGVAERIPLGERSVAAVFAADSFHWFDEARAVPEMRRVLRPRGGVALLRTVPLHDTSWGRELGAILNEVRPEHPAFTERGAAAAFEQDPAFGAVSETTMRSPQRTDGEGILAYIASLSWVGTLAPGDRARLLARARAILEREGVEGEVRYEAVHQIWVAKLL